MLRVYYISQQLYYIGHVTPIVFHCFQGHPYHLPQLTSYFWMLNLNVLFGKPRVLHAFDTPLVEWPYIQWQPMKESSNLSGAEITFLSYCKSYIKRILIGNVKLNNSNV